MSESLDVWNRAGYLKDAFFDYDKADIRADARRRDKAQAEYVAKLREAAKVELLNETTVRYSWSKPNPDFLARMAGACGMIFGRSADST